MHAHTNNKITLTHKYTAATGSSAGTKLVRTKKILQEINKQTKQIKKGLETKQGRKINEMIIDKTNKQTTSATSQESKQTAKM